MKERHIPLEVFLKKDFRTNRNQSWQIHQDDVWTRKQNEDDLCFEISDDKPRSHICEIYLHHGIDGFNAFYLEPLSKNDIVYKLKH